MYESSYSKNDYLEHYTKHNISPVRQNIFDIKSHILRRASLYRTLGLLPSSFTGKKVLEVGPGSGFNSFVNVQWNPSKYVLVEPNPTGVLHIKSLFNEQYNSKIEIVNKRIEDFFPDEQFDIVLCEGMIPGLKNKEQILTKLDSLLKDEGVLVITCADEISMFFEIIRIFFAHKLTKDLNGFDEKIQVAINAFGSHLDTLSGFNRLKEDWCADSLFGFAHFNYDFSLKKCAMFLGDKYFIYHTSPNIFTDYRWYKELPLTPKEFNQHLIDQFDMRKHNLIHYQVITPDREKERNEELLNLCKQAMLEVYNSVKYDDSDAEKKLIDIIGMMQKNLLDTDLKIINALKEIQEIIENKDYTVKAINSKYMCLISAFGRGQQYISLCKSKNI